MTRPFPVLLLLLLLRVDSFAARCTTTIEAGVRAEYDEYVNRAEQGMAARFQRGELAWAPSAAARELAAKLAGGRMARLNISDPVWNQKLAPRNGTILHWIGAIRIADAALADLQTVLKDYELWERIYRPMVTGCRVKARGTSGGDELTLALQSTFRFLSLIPQRYAFQAKATAIHEGPAAVHLRVNEIRESDSGVPGRNDLLEPYRDHGILWGLNAYWRAQKIEAGLYLEFETITLARSAQAFVCRLGPAPVPRSIVSSAMDTVPAESVRVVLEGTKAECERRSAQRKRAAGER